MAQVQGRWIGVWWSGAIGWLYSPPGHPVVLRSSGVELTPAAGKSSVPVYGRAYPEQAAYAPYQIPYQTVTPLQYSIGAGQAYVLADANIQTDYYHAVSFNCAHAVDDCTDVVGQVKYYEIWYNHRIAYVQADDVVVKN
ncbi:MAG: hypothetical protein ACRDPG_10115 [Nocardioidaceae bacterium]